jgi:hypothetical protein
MRSSLSTSSACAALGKLYAAESRFRERKMTPQRRQPLRQKYSAAVLRRISVTD